MPESTSPKRSAVNVHAKISLHSGALKIVKMNYDLPRFSSDIEENVAREIVLREDSAAALVHDVERDIIILCEQFRAPVFQTGGGWLVELPAGKLDGEETPENCMKRELEEEIGYRADSLHPISAYFAAPGYSTERVHLFYAPVAPGAFIDAKAHGVDQGEDIRRVEQSRSAFLEHIRQGSFEDGKILAAGAWALQHLAN